MPVPLCISLRSILQSSVATRLISKEHVQYGAIARLFGPSWTWTSYPTRFSAEPKGAGYPRCELLWDAVLEYAALIVLQMEHCVEKHARRHWNLQGVRVVVISFLSGLDFQRDFFFKNTNVIATAMAKELKLLRCQHQLRNENSIRDRLAVSAPTLT